MFGADDGNGERVFYVRDRIAYRILTSRQKGLLGVTIRLQSGCEKLQSTNDQKTTQWQKRDILRWNHADSALGCK